MTTREGKNKSAVQEWHVLRRTCDGDCEQAGVCDTTESDRSSSTGCPLLLNDDVASRNLTPDTDVTEHAHPLAHSDTRWKVADKPDSFPEPLLHSCEDAE